MVPDVNKPEWQELIRGKLSPQLTSFSLQMKINTLKQQYKLGLVKIDKAVADLRDLCVKYERIYTEDLNKIFNN